MNYRIQASVVNRTLRSRGFTLIEVIAAITIIAVLTTILIPAISSIRKKSNAAVGASNLRGISTALNLYASENGNFYPMVGISAADWNKANPNDQVGASLPWTKLLRDYLPLQGPSRTARENKIFVCPNANYLESTGSPYGVKGTARTYSATEALYGIRQLSNRLSYDSKSARRVNTIENPATTILVIDAKQNGTSAACFSGTQWSKAMVDRSANDTRSTTYIDFRQPGNTAHVLYAGGRVGTLTLEDFKALEIANWSGRQE
jgi:prepilin-type N-terminal cleavage/methylation domain-containing protein